MSLTNLVILFVTCTLSAVAQTVNYRLPNTVRPTHYILEIDTNMTAFTFSGFVAITSQIQQPTNTIVLHSRDLVLNNVTVIVGTTNFYARHDFVPATDFLRIFLTQNLTVGQLATIHIHYDGALGTGNVGYYRASYVNENNQTRFMAVTHLEATNARRAFPCFDQPNLKATFQITLIRDAPYITASNMRIGNQAPAGINRTRDLYQTTQVMSTYLIAFMVSDYESIEVLNAGIAYRTFGRSEFIRRGDGNYSLSVAQNAITRMINFTTILYALNTMDQVPVPNEYYKIGAMENWGMVTYREKYLMYSGERTTTAEKQFITTIISHELAHQWFGNLVTPEWWRYIWLNEGFATYLEMFITSQFEPTWQLMEQFITSMVQPALQDDALPDTRPMTRNAESPAEIDAQYDTIVYEKAGSVIRMAANFLGNAAFTNGLVLYLNNRSFANAVPQDLYASWQSVPGTAINVSNIMTSWEMQAGYPVVTVNRTGNSFQLNQQRFFANSPTTNDQSLWHIPLNWLTPVAAANAIEWFDTRNRTITINVNAAQWVIFNINQMGFYRVNYDENSWALIINVLRTGNIGAIPVINRAQLVDDAFNLARSGRLNLTIAVDLGAYIANETEYVPIATFVKAFSHLDRLFTGRPQFPLIRSYGIAALEGYFNRTGFIQNNDAHLIRLTKVEVLTWLCRLNHEGCRNHTRLAFNSWINQNAVQPDSQSFVYCNGIRDGTHANWDTALQRYSALREDTQRTRIAQALGCSSDSVLLQRVLSHVSLNVLTRSDKASAITSLYTNNGIIGVRVFLEWLTPNFQVLMLNVDNVASIIKGVANRITTNEQATEFNQFVTMNRNSFTPAMNTTANTAQTTVSSNLQWITQTSTDIDNHFGNASIALYGHILLLIICILLNILHIY